LIIRVRHSIVTRKKTKEQMVFQSQVLHIVDYVEVKTCNSSIFSINYGPLIEIRVLSLVTPNNTVY
jgi:hypothetical protein